MQFVPDDLKIHIEPRAVPTQEAQVGFVGLHFLPEFKIQFRGHHAKPAFLRHSVDQIAQRRLLAQLGSALQPRGLQFVLRENDQPRRACAVHHKFQTGDLADEDLLRVVLLPLWTLLMVPIALARWDVLPLVSPFFRVVRAIARRVGQLTAVLRPGSLYRE